MHQCSLSFTFPVQALRRVTTRSAGVGTGCTSSQAGGQWLHTASQVVPLKQMQDTHPRLHHRTAVNLPGRDRNISLRIFTAILKYDRDKTRNTAVCTHGDGGTECGSCAMEHAPISNELDPCPGRGI